MNTSKDSGIHSAPKDPHEYLAEAFRAEASTQFDAMTEGEVDHWLSLHGRNVAVHRGARSCPPVHRLARCNADLLSFVAGVPGASDAAAGAEEIARRTHAWDTLDLSDDVWPIGSSAFTEHLVSRARDAGLHEHRGQDKL